MTIAAGTTVTLSGNGVYIFRPDGSLDAAANSNVVAADGACENDVFWTPTGGTTLGDSSNFVGNIFRGTAAGLSITLGDSATLTGRALAFGSTVTTDNNTIGLPTCPPILPFSPEITLTKTITDGDPFSEAGDTITYSLVAENTGNVELTDVTISDPDVTLSNCSPAQGSTLQPNDTLSCEGSYTVIPADVTAGSFTNTAMVVGIDPNDEMVEDTDSATATSTDFAPQISLTKTITSGDPYSAEGDTITYSLVAVNTGNVALTDVTISDPDVVLTNCSPAQGSTLQPSDTMSCEGSYSVIQEDVIVGSFTNTAMVVGFAPNDEMVDDTDSATANSLAIVPPPTEVPGLTGLGLILLTGFLALFGLLAVSKQVRVRLDP